MVIKGDTMSNAADSIIDLSKYNEVSTQELEELTSSNIAPATGTATYRFRVTSAETKTWEDGKSNLNLRTEVIDGDNAGKFGPFMNLGLHPFAWPGEELTGEKLEAATTKQQIKFVERVRLLRDDVPTTIPSGSEIDVLEAVGVMLDGQEFIASVKRSAKGYAQFSNYYATSKPPMGYGAVVDAFSL